MKRKSLIFLLIVITLVLCKPIFSNAENKETVLRMAWYETENYQETDFYGNFSGYVGEYINEITDLTGVKFEIVNASWEESFELLKNGEVDLLCGASYTKTRDVDFDFVMPSVLKYHYNIATLEGNGEGYRGSQSLQGKNIGFLKGSVAYEYFVTEKSNVSANYIEYIDIKSLLLGLKNGEIDYMLQTNKYSNDEDIVILDTFKDTDGYFLVKNEDYETNSILTKAINLVEKEKFNFKENLFNKYFNPDGDTLYLSMDEKNAINELGTFKVYLDEKTEYYNYVKDGEIRGITPDIARLVANELGLELQLKYINTGEILTRQTPCFIADMPNYHNWATTFYNCSYMTSPYYSKNFYTVKRENYNIEEDKNIEAIFSNNRPYYTYSPYGTENVSLVKTTESMLDKISLGSYDVGIIDNIEQNYWEEGYKFINLQYSYIPYSYEVCFGAVGEYDEDAIDAINKVLEIKLPIVLNEIAEASLIESKYEPEFLEKLNATPELLAGMVFGLALLAFLSFLYLYVSYINKKLLKANIKAENANIAKSEFLARMSHDMRTPMNAVIAFSDFGIDEGRDETDVKYFKQIKESSNYLMGLLNDMLDMQKIENGNIALNKTIVKEDEFLNNIKNLVVPRAKEKNISILFEAANNCPNYSKIDMQRTTQIYVNLLNNAIKYTPNGGKVKWESEYYPNQGKPYFLVRISDNGAGMSKEFQKTMYEPFSMENSNIDNVDLGGSGLGLSITKNLVESIGGEINCKSELYKGTVFTLKMPTEPATKYDYELQQGKFKYSNYEELEGLQILVCEDNAINQRVIAKILDNYGLVLTFAKDGYEGVMEAKSNKYDYIIMDIRMPIMDGLTAAREIRKFDVKTPIIAISANAYAEDVDKSIEAGMDAHIAKPINKVELIEVFLMLRGQDG